jgi:hypothetical protein
MQFSRGKRSYANIECSGMLSGHDVEQQLIGGVWRNQDGGTFVFGYSPTFALAM